MRKSRTRETKKTMARALVCGFLLTAVWGMFPFAASCAGLPEHVVRLHVIANSDSRSDQAVKEKVRDAVLLEAAKWYGDADTMEEASSALCVHLEALQEAANEALRENGVQEKAVVRVTEQYFTTREYERFTLPAGTYRTLLVTIGEGKGKNWWCVVFPALCLPAAEERTDTVPAEPDRPSDVLSALPEAQRDVVENPGQYKIKFKAVELFEELKRWLTG